MTGAPDGEMHAAAGVLVMPRDVLEAAHSIARGAYPAEGCALLIGRRLPSRCEWRVTRLLPVRNVLAGERNDRFEIDPQVLFDTQRTLREVGASEEIIGHVHSHPAGRPVPSETDAANAFDPDHAWLIVAVDVSGNAEAAAWVPYPQPEADEPVFRKLEMKVVPAHPEE